MKAACSTSCFSNNSDYYREYVKWKQLKERRLLNYYYHYRVLK